ncbi:MAG: hypothetical protein ACREBA_09825, partial [Nitrosotalea sp.]
MTVESEIKKIFEDAFDTLKREFYHNHKIEEREEDTRPDILSFRDMIESLPPSLQIIELTSSDNLRLRNGKGFLIKYDFDKLKSNHLEFCGSTEYGDTEKLTILMAKKFHFDKKTSECLTKDLFTKGFR